MFIGNGYSCNGMFKLSIINKVILLFFLHVHTRIGGEGIRTYDLRFIRRDSQPIKLPLEDLVISHYFYIVESSSLWHGRLTHLNFKYLKYMSKRGLISYKHDNNEKREICIQAKMTPNSLVMSFFFSTLK
jgi:hypothetical protein